ncbi:MAG: DMT family transporter [Candidatus Delongbacteria bacterium]|jgi:drug/metabolite transporter (DMT)-like permease|nr:DMT family transporter [Candidatus Delongbacteria bacterium]
MLILLIIINLLWASTFIFGKILLNDFSIPVSFIISFRFLVAGITVGLIFWKKINLSKNVIWKGSVIGSINGLAMIFQLVGLQYTTASNSGFLTATYILFLPFVEKLFWRNKIRNIVLVSVVTAFLGVYLLSVSNFGTLEFNVGDIYTIACGITFAFQIMFISHFTKEKNMYSLIFIQFMASAAMGFGYLGYEMLVIGESIDFGVIFEPKVISTLVFLAIFATFIPFSLQFYVQKKVNPTIAGLAYLMEPVFTVILAVIFLSEGFGWQTFFGILLILSGIVMVNIKKKAVTI